MLKIKKASYFKNKGKKQRRGIKISKKIFKQTSLNLNGFKTL